MTKVRDAAADVEGAPAQEAGAVPADSGVRVVTEGPVDPPQDTLETWPCAADVDATGGRPRAPFVPLDLAPLRALYEGAEEPAVVAFVASCMELVPVLLEAAPRLRAAFGGRVSLCLEAPVFTGGKLSVRVYDHLLSADEADVRAALFDAWLDAAYPARSAVRRWLDFGIGWGGPPTR